MNHLLRSLAPITATGLGAARGGGPAAAGGRARVAPARRLRRARTAGTTRRRTSGAPRRSPTAPGEGVSARRRVVLPVVEHRVPFTVSRAELADIDRGAEDPDLDALGEAARRMALAENTAVFGGVADASPHAPIALGDDMDDVPDARRPGRGGPAPLGRQRPVRDGARPGRVHRGDRDAPSTAAIRCSSTCGRSSAARSSGRPASTAPSSSACAAATSSSTAVRTSRSATTATTARRCRCTSSSPSRSASRRREAAVALPAPDNVPALCRSLRPQVFPAFCERSARVA